MASRERNQGKAEKEKKGDEETFKTPRSWASQGNLMSIDLTENKRTRNETEDSDTEHSNSGASAKKYRRASEQTRVTGDSESEVADNEWQDVGQKKQQQLEKEVRS